MGLFDKIKKVFVSKEKEDKVYDEGLKKSRNEFVSQLSNLSKKYKNISEDYRTFGKVRSRARLWLLR